VRADVTEAGWGAGKREGGTPGVGTFTRAASLLRVARSQVGAWLPQESRGDHAPQGCPCLFVTSVCASSSLKRALKLSAYSKPMEQTGKGLGCECIPADFVPQSSWQRGQAPCVSHTREKAENHTCTGKPAPGKRLY